MTGGFCFPSSPSHGARWHTNSHSSPELSCRHLHTWRGEAAWTRAEERQPRTRGGSGSGRPGAAASGGPAHRWTRPCRKPDVACSRKWRGCPFSRKRKRAVGVTPDVSVPSAFTTNLAAGRPPSEPGVRRATAAGPAPRARAADTRPSAVAASQPGHTRDVHTRSRSHPGHAHAQGAHTQGTHTWGTLTPRVITHGERSHPGCAHPGHTHTRGTLTPRARSHPGHIHTRGAHTRDTLTPTAWSRPWHAHTRRSSSELRPNG